MSPEPNQGAVLDAAPSPPFPRVQGETFFSSREFVEAWCRALGGGQAPFAIPVRGSGVPRTMYAVQTAASRWSSRLELGPMGVYGSPGWEGTLEQPTVAGILHRLCCFRTRDFLWNVRFDHHPLADQLQAAGLNCERTTTYVLTLSEDYDRTFAAFNSTIRNQVRQARRKGVVVRQAESDADVEAYYGVHARLASEKGTYCQIYPVQLFHELVKLRPRVRLLVAECAGVIAGGGLFFRDGDGVIYWHAAADRQYSKSFPACAVLDEGIRWACETKAAHINLGGSGGIQSLEQFKAFWGATPRANWAFRWRNTFRDRLDRVSKGAQYPVKALRGVVRRVLRAFGGSAKDRPSGPGIKAAGLFTDRWPQPAR